MRLLGSGLEPLMLPNELPATPVLVLGLQGSGRRTHVEAILAERNAVAVIRSEERGQHVKADLAREIVEIAQRPTRSKVWVSLNLTQQSIVAQNILLKTLEKAPPHMQFFLRGTANAVLPTVVSRCAVYRLVPPSREDQTGLLLEQGVEFDSAQAAVDASPGSVGGSIALAKTAEQRERAKALLLAAESRSIEQIAAGLAHGWSPDCVQWLKIWLEDAMLGQADVAVALSREASTHVLSTAYNYLQSVHNSKLAARAALTVLAERPR